MSSTPSPSTLYAAHEALNVQLGMYGSVIVNSTTPVTGSFVGLQFITNTVITSIIAPYLTLQSGSISGITFPAGTTLYTVFSAVKLSSGVAQAIIASI